jgi:hypothetical protein
MDGAWLAECYWLGVTEDEVVVALARVAALAPAGGTRPDFHHITRIQLVAQSSSAIAANDYAITNVEAVRGSGCGLPISLPFPSRQNQAIGCRRKLVVVVSRRLGQRPVLSPVDLRGSGSRQVTTVAEG